LCYFETKFGNQNFLVEENHLESEDLSTAITNDSSQTSVILADNAHLLFGLVLAQGSEMIKIVKKLFA